MSFFNSLFEIKNEDDFVVSGLGRELNVIYVYEYFLKFKRSMIILTNSLYEANDLYGRMLNYTDNVLFFPMDDFMASEATFVSPELMLERLSTLNRLISDAQYIVITNLMGFLRYLPSKELYKQRVLKLSKNMDIDREKLITKLNDLGYERVSLVTKSGEMAVRGYVLDVFPIECEEPIRIEFWGDTIDSIKVFDLESQISNNEIDDVIIYPFTEMLVPDGIVLDNKEKKQKYLRAFSNDVGSIFNYLDNPVTVYYDYNQIMVGYNLLKETIFDYDKEVISDIKTNYMWDIEDISLRDCFYLMEVDNLTDLKVKNSYRYLSFNIDNYSGNFEKVKNDLEKFLLKGKTVILCISDKNVVNRVVNYLEIDDKIIFADENNIIKNKINIVGRSINSGFIYEDFVVITQNDLFGKKEEKKKIKSKYKVGTRISNIDNIEKGEYIVHIDHGIGIYSEICTLTKNGLKKDYIKLIYADGDILYLPVEKIDKISKFSGKEGNIVKLDKLGSDGWRKKKARVKEKLQNIAGDLIRVSAEREAMKGYAFSLDDENQILFESNFKYEPTADQIRATNIIKEQMERDRPMDLLLCGDVGYGKTEVAFRAMFKAVNDGKQVAYLCPTTILSSQQFKSAIERFADFPINIALLNRFTSASEQKRILDGLKNGTIDILFGTHKILNDKIGFKDLGLLVIDEEQRFGVVHKEKIKKYKNSIDVLTLSATPIPRTLQMSMSGIRGLALIETPPERRRPIQTYVMPENKNIVKDAIYKELTRKGQIYILYNNIEKLDSKLLEISELVPDARIRCAHGRLDKMEIEKIMTDFVNHEFDILLCTTIIETGIDIANVNTLIIFDADHFGLSQLYQIRGRIGRSDKIGYAYLMYNGRKELNDLAVKRLNTIKEFTELGSGFKIAMRDLSIRGAGDILGSEQSGFIDSIGIDLYLKMLKDAVDKLKGLPVEDEADSDKPLIEVETHISNEYAPDDEIKIEIHKMINEVSSYDDIDRIKKELENRFGKVTDEMIIYMQEELFEKQAKKMEVVNSKQIKNMIDITLSKEVSSRIDGEKLFFSAYEISKNFKFKYVDEEIHILFNTEKLEKHFIFYLNELLEMMLKEMVKR